jgi:trehalose/maltose hydrolase-like predicted phosphorylase
VTAASGLRSRSTPGVPARSVSCARPRWRRSLLACAAALVMLLPPFAGARATAAGTGAETGGGSYVLTATGTGAGYTPTFTGNGYLGVRVPASGQGYVEGRPRIESTLAGFYAQAPGMVQQRADLPAWDTLVVAAAGEEFSLPRSSVTGWRQRIDLRDGVITTTARWSSADGNIIDLGYDVLVDRARPHVAAVRLRLTPHRSGTALVTDLIDGTPATLTTPVARGWDPRRRRQWETIATQGTGIVAGLASRMELGRVASATSGTPVEVSAAQSVGQRVTLSVRAGTTYTVTKYVGVVTADSGEAAASDARHQADAAAAAGFELLSAESGAAWRSLWRGRIEVLGDPALATEVNASEFYLWASIRDGVDWSTTPGGLSSNAYNGHVFWDAETWMHPALLAQHPDLAAGIDAYRLDRLDAAAAHAREGGYGGARFPWESALDGSEQTAPPAASEEGVYEQHITADIALAQWQHYLATGDRGWLARAGWPVISAAAAFWASRAVRDEGGAYHIAGVTGPDEENEDVDDEVYTNVAAATTLRIASRAARIAGAAAPASWTAIADGLAVLYDARTGLNPEFVGYRGQIVQQADATMLAYPWGYQAAPGAAERDLDYYVPRTDPDGPSMTDSISSVDTSALGLPGCSSYMFTLRSAEPFIRDVFDQFSELTTGGAFTFVTGIGGFLQEFLYGYSGLRWAEDGVRLDPTLTGQLGGVVLRDLQWHHTRFTVSIGPQTTTVSVGAGRALRVVAGGTSRVVPVGETLTLPTRRPDLEPTTDLARCRPATASSSRSGADVLAAVDGSPATAWQPRQVAATLLVALARAAVIRSVALQWGEHYTSPQAGANGPAVASTLRATSYDLLVSADGRTWTVVARVRGRTAGIHDVLAFPAVHARLVKLRILAATLNVPPMLAELRVPAS